MAGLPPSERPFPFFELPQELRDEIYLYCTEDCKPRTANGEEQKSHDDDESEGSHVIQVFCKRGPSRSLQLVSRQFRFEYLDIVKKQAEIHFDDECVNESDAGWAPPLSDHLFARFSSAKLCLLETSATFGAGDLKLHCKWVSEMQHQFSMLSKVDIVLRLITSRITSRKPVYYPDSPAQNCPEFLENIAKLIDLTGASNLEVILGDCSGTKGWNELSRDSLFQETSTTYGKWSKEDGWVVEAEKQA